MSIATVWRLAASSRFGLMEGMTKPIDAEVKPGSGGGRSRETADTSTPPKRLEKLFGDPLPKREAAMWSLMDAAQRARALQRVDALVRYNDGEGDVPARLAAADAGVTLVRFYQMNARWREERSLGALGVGAQPERGRKSQFAPEVNAVLQSAVAALVRDEKSSVRSLALRLADIARARGLSDDQIPSHNTLRNVVERARREWRRRLDVGNELLLDQAACGISREDGAPWIVFVIADAASQLILGAAAGWAESVRRGYAEAAMDAARRIGDPSFSKVVWAERLARVRLVPGAEEKDAFDSIASEARAIGVGLNLTAERKAGRYLERLAGRAIGVLPIWPARVGATTLPSWASERAPVLDLERARARISIAVDDYNSSLLDGLDTAGESVPPPELEHFLKALAN